MLRVHRFVPALLLGTVAISVSACGNKPAPKPNTTSVAEPVETGPDLFPKLPMPKPIARDTGAEPIIASQAVMQFDQRIQVPSEVDGRVEIIGTPCIAVIAAALLGSASTIDTRMRNLSELANRRHRAMSP